MCGLFGYIGNSAAVSKDVLNKVSDSLKHRGPDDSGLLQNSDFALGFRRLSIIDLSPHGHQPMSSADNLHHLVFNGEIYNHLELKTQYLEKNICLKGHTDTEILLNLLINKNEALLPLLNGMFAFSYINKIKNTFLLARDRLGVKPLYYAVQNNTLYFASELPALLDFGLRRDIDTIALNRYVRFGHISPPQTIFKNIFKLEPGHYIKGSLERATELTKTQWWELPLEENYSKTESQWLSYIDDILCDATQIRLISDVPVGLFLSGGLDSSLVAHYASSQTRFNKPKAFSVIFNEREYNEYDIAQSVAAAKKLDLVTIKVQANSLSELDLIINNVGEPLSDASLVNQYNLSKEARRHAIVFLSGDGGDEAFCGYDEYVRMYGLRNSIGLLSFSGRILYPLLKTVLKFDSNLKQQLSKFSAGPACVGAVVRNNFFDPILEQLLEKPYRIKESTIYEQALEDWKKTKGLPFVKRMQLFDYKNYLEPQVLVKVDRATMANSIENRSPFLDYRVVEAALTIPNSFNVAATKGKLLLRKLAAKHLPAVVSNAPKKGFGLPVKRWIDDSIRKRLVLLNIENGHNIWNMNMFNKIIYSNSHSRDLSAIFWRILIFETWYKDFFKPKGL